VGRTIYRGTREPVPYRVIGVVEDFRFGDITDDVEPMAFDPFRRSWVPSSAAIQVRSSAGVGAVAAAVRSVVNDLDPNLPVYDVATVRELSRAAFSEQSMLARLVGGFAVLALLLAALGLYGVVNYAVAARTSEFGLRMALGAQRRDVLGMVLREALRLAGAGAAIGLAAALGVTRLIQSRLFDVTPLDPVVFSIAVAVLLGTAVLATYIPARRATTVDPMLALRRE
jgi:ABC-type antimicrobial peptide transport system permease subunit